MRVHWKRGRGIRRALASLVAAAALVYLAWRSRRSPRVAGWRDGATLALLALSPLVPIAATMATGEEGRYVEPLQTPDGRPVVADDIDEGTVASTRGSPAASSLEAATLSDTRPRPGQRRRRSSSTGAATRSIEKGLGVFVHIEPSSGDAAERRPRAALGRARPRGRARRTRRCATSCRSGSPTTVEARRGRCGSVSGACVAAASACRVTDGGHAPVDGGPRARRILRAALSAAARRSRRHANAGAPPRGLLGDDDHRRLDDRVGDLHRALDHGRLRRDARRSGSASGSSAAR